MKQSKQLLALWTGEILSEVAGAAGSLVNGLLIYELTGSQGLLALMWLVYYIPSIILQGVSSPFLNYVRKEKMLRNIQLIRALAYLFLFLDLQLMGKEWGIAGLVVLQMALGMLQPIYASLSFSILPDICSDEKLIKANGLMDATIRIMSFIAPGIGAATLAVLPLQSIYIVSVILFLASFWSLSCLHIKKEVKAVLWTRLFWWEEMKAGYKLFYAQGFLFRLTLLSAVVQFAVGASLVMNIPFIREILGGEKWEYGIFSAAFPLGYALGMLLLMKTGRNAATMYHGLIGGGLSFVCLFFTHSIPIAWLCELVGGLLFPLFNAQSAALFQRYAPREVLGQLSAIRLLFIRTGTLFGILFASSPLLSEYIKPGYLFIGLSIVIPGLFYLVKERQLLK